MAPWNKITCFWGRSNFHPFFWKTLDFEVLKSTIWKHTTLCDMGVFPSIIFFHQLSSNYHRFVNLYITYVEIHQVRGLVFANNPRCSVSLTATCTCTLFSPNICIVYNKQVGQLKITQRLLFILILVICFNGNPFQEILDLTKQYKGQCCTWSFVGR